MSHFRKNAIPLEFLKLVLSSSCFQLRSYLQGGGIIIKFDFSTFRISLFAINQFETLVNSLLTRVSRVFGLWCD